MLARLKGGDSGGENGYSILEGLEAEVEHTVANGLTAIKERTPGIINFFAPIQSASNISLSACSVTLYDMQPKKAF